MSEYLRQFIHVFFGSTIILSLVLFGRMPAIALSALGLLGSVLLSIAIKKNIKMPFIQKFIEDAQRKSENKFPVRGAIAFCLGSLLVLVFFEKFFAELGALCVLVFGDGFSTIIGTVFGKIMITSKHTLEGTIGGMLVSFVFLATFLDWFLAFFVSTVAMLTELLGMEDNIVIPISAALILSLVL